MSRTGHGVRGRRVDNQGCFTCGRRAYISPDCPQMAQLVRSAGTTENVVKRKNWVEHGPMERRMGPNKEGWVEAKNTFLHNQ